ncbi:MAG: hypothetical protein IKO01_12045 [Kiritimatiellae bacterium]|nr:hypothetical protein [Kiritimatiellia bacterium]
MNRTASSIRPLAAASLAACLLLGAAAPAARASESTVILGTPAPATLRNTTDASRNEWLAANSAFIAEAFFTATAATSQLATANRPQYVLASSETGFPLERTIPAYYLGDQLVPPDGVDWPATYAAYTNSPDAPCFIFDTADSRVFVAEGGTHSFTWVRADGEPLAMNYVVSPACSGRPRRIYWTDDPWNAPAIDLTGKFVKFFGDPEILDPVFGTVTNYAGGMPQVITNQIVSGLHLDTSTHFLNAHGQLQGQVVMVYYDTGNFERILHVQVVEVCRPVVNRMAGEIGRALRPDGRGYDVSGLRARPTVVSPTDGRGEYLYQHKGRHSYSPKNGNVYPLRPTADCPWNAEIYWMETDEMEVQWPFEVDQYACDWPADATVFVRGDAEGDGGRPVYIPFGLEGTVMDYQEPDGHALAVAPDGTFDAVGEGYSLLRLTADDDIWFFPIHSLFRTNTDYFTLEPGEAHVGSELHLRGGSASGLADGFDPDLDPTSPGYIYPPVSSPDWNPALYAAPAPDPRRTGSSATDGVSPDGTADTNTYASVIYPVRARDPNATIEVWWNTTLREEGMPEPLVVPTLPQVYSVRWPLPGETPQIVIASQLGSDADSIFSQNLGAYLEDATSAIRLGNRSFFDAATGGTVMAWVRPEDAADDTPSSLLTLGSDPATAVVVDIRRKDGETRLQVTCGTNTVSCPYLPDPRFMGWMHVALSFSGASATVHFDCGPAEIHTLPLATPPFHAEAFPATIGAANGLPARAGAEIGEVLVWNTPMDEEAIAFQYLTPHDGTENHLAACYTFVKGTDLNVTSTDERTVHEKVFGAARTAHRCLAETEGPPAWGKGSIVPDPGTAARIYLQNDPAATGYNPNEEHALLTAAGDRRIAWALRSDLNTDATSEPGVLVEYVKHGRKAMQWFAVAATNDAYPILSAPATAGLAFPGPHPIDLLDDPWCPKDAWDEPAATAPAFRDRKGQLWARAAGNATMRMYYRNQEGFAYPSLATNKWPAVNEEIPWIALLGGDPSADPLAAQPAAWTWEVTWPDEVPEMEIGRTLTTATDGLPEVWNAKSAAVVWPPTTAEAESTALLFDPTVARTAGFTDFTVKQLIDKFGIQSGAGGHATQRQGKWYFDDLPPNLSTRFYLDTTADPGSCLKLVGEREDNPGAVSLLHVNVLSDDERDTLAHLVDETAENGDAISLWQSAIATLATNAVRPSVLATDTGEPVVSYTPSDHYALFTMGATNYVTLIENDAPRMVPAPGTTNLVASGVSDGDPISMHILKVVPKYYTGRVVTREDPCNLLSQQLSVIYAEAFAGEPGQYEFEWRKARPSADGTVPTAYDDPSIYSLKFPVTNGLTRFVVGAQGDTLADMVNTYYSVRYRAASTNSPAWAAMGDAWSDWSDPPCLAEGWVQRVLNNVTPFYQRMRDLYENPAETAVSMIVQAGAPYEGDIALNQDNLASVGLIQLYETLLSKAESLSLLLGIDDADANKQLQLAVGRLADMYGVLGDEAWTDALNPTISFGADFDTPDMTGLALDYGALSGTLFAFDNQVPTLLDEELALLRGRTGDNAPALTISPYYNRLVWNFTRGITAGEVAYAVNYDISGNRSGTIDAQQAALQYPQGHGDAYGHYLSALSAYYRLLRNPYFSWGKPAMGELVVNDAVVNADEYDEARFASVAHDVAKVAAETVDRTARKAYRDNGGATGAGYLDSAASRNFGYGEWAARGGYGALCNWAVANSLLPPAPDVGHYVRFAFTNRDSAVATALAVGDQPALLSNSLWTVEFQLLPAAPAVDPLHAGPAVPVRLEGEHAALEFRFDPSNTLTVAAQPLSGTNLAVRTAYYVYTNADWNINTWTPDQYSELVCTDGTGLLAIECAFFGTNAPAAFPESWTFTSLTAPPDFSAAGWHLNSVDETGTPEPYIYDTPVSSKVPDGPPILTPLATLPSGVDALVALVSDPTSLTALVLAPDGAVLASQPLGTPDGFRLGRIESIALGGGFLGEIGEFRVWGGDARTADELHDKRECVSPTSTGLDLYLRTLSAHATRALVDDANPGVSWTVSSGAWLPMAESGMALAFEDEGLKRIDRSTVPALSALANLVPDIQKKLDRLDAGLNPLGLSSGAIPFDLTPVTEGDETRTHFEQIRERAQTALSNARRILDRAQASGNRLRLIQEAQIARDDLLERTEQDYKHRLVEYFGYPYEGDIGPSGTYPQSYDGPDLLHYAWMDLADYGITDVADTVTATIVEVKGATSTQAAGQDILGMDTAVSTNTLTFELSANGLVLKPANIAGKRRAQGRIQEALGEFLSAYADFGAAMDVYDYACTQLEYELNSIRAGISFHVLRTVYADARQITETALASTTCAMQLAMNTLEFTAQTGVDISDGVLKCTPSITGAGMTVNVDPSAVVAAATIPAVVAENVLTAAGILAAKNAIDGFAATHSFLDLGQAALDTVLGTFQANIAWYEQARAAYEMQLHAMLAANSAFRQLTLAQAKVETVIAEAQRILDDRRLLREQATDVLTKMRYNEMFFRLDRNEALSRYQTAFELAQKYTYLAAQAYDYETGLLTADPASGEAFIARIVGARTLGEFAPDGTPLPASDGVKGDGGLAAILAELDADWLVLKPRLGINNPQKYATWFSLRKEHFRIYPDSRGDEAWKTALRQCWVDDLRAVPEFTRLCQPLAGSEADAEPGLVIPFDSMIAFGRNYFGEETVGGDSTLDSTWFATHIAAAGVHFAGYDDTSLSKTPAVYLVPAGADRFRAVGDPDTVLSWNVVDQVIPAPYPIGATQLDDPDWTPLYTGHTGGADPGAKIRKHPSFRAYYAPTNASPSDTSLDCTRLVGRSAWNTRWLLIIPAGSLGSDRETALSTLVNGRDTDRDGTPDTPGITDILLGLKTYSHSGN